MVLIFRQYYLIHRNFNAAYGIIKLFNNIIIKLLNY